MSSPFKPLVNGNGHPISSDTPADVPTLADALGTPTRGKDSLMRPLAVGDIVLFSPAVQIPFTVAAVRPSLDPRAPAGMTQIIFQGEFPFNCVPGRNEIVPCTRIVSVAEATAKE